MSRVRLFVGVAAYLVIACDDGALRAFEPRTVEAGGTGGGGSSSEAGGGRGGTTPIDAPAGAGPAEPSAPLLIDDFEDGDVRSKEPRGWWYPVNDGTGLQGFGVEPVTRGAASVYALRTHGSGFQEWGAALGVNLVGDSTPLSLQSYEELCFTARVDAATTTLIQVHFLQEPNRHYSQEISLSETWTQHCLKLRDFRHVEDGTALVADELIALQFFLPPGFPFGLWLDDVEATP